MPVTFSVNSLVRGGFVGGGSVIQFRTKAEPASALDAFVAAARIAERQFVDDTSTVSTSAAAQNPVGPVLVMQLCDSAELLEQWCQAVARQLEATGFSGSLAPAASIEIPTLNAPAITACVQMHVDWDALIETPAPYSSPTAGWWVSQDRTDRLLDVPG